MIRMWSKFLAWLRRVKKLPAAKAPSTRRTSPVPASGYTRDWERGGWRESDAAFEERSGEVDDDVS
jgi:hypothetical protein